MKNSKLFGMSFARVYNLYVKKVERKGRSKSEVNDVIKWLTGYSQSELNSQIKKDVDMETFIKESPDLNPSRKLIKGIICGVRVEDIEDPIMQIIRYMDKLVDEVAKGRAMEKILRK